MIRARPQRLKQATQREQAYHGLRRMLILQRIPESERLSEPEWARRLGVNRAALREAFARLEAEGLIERGPKTGYVVPILTEADIHDIMEVRKILECGAVDIICATKSPNLKPMIQACDELESLLARDYLLGASEADRRFHEALVDLADNRRLSMVYHRAPLPMIHRQLMASDRWYQECRQTLADHRNLIAHIKAGDAAKAKALLRAHLDERCVLPIPTH